MRKILPILAGMSTFLLTGCDLFQKQRPIEDSRRQVPVTIFEANGDDSSPIIVGGGSIHVRQFSHGIYQIDLNHAYINLKDHVAKDVSIGNCPTSGHNCAYPNTQSTTASLTAPWKMQLQDYATKKVVAYLSATDASGLIFLWTENGDPSVQPTMAVEDQDSSRDGEGMVVCGLAHDPHGCSITLGSATITMNGNDTSHPVTLTCPDGSAHPPGGQLGNTCKIRIGYCNNKGGSANSACDVQP